MTAAELAATLDGREYGSEIEADEERAAKEAGLVVLFGASDDLAEFRGAIDEELGCYGGGTIAVGRDGLYDVSDPDDVCCRFMRAALESAATIKAIWCPDGTASWGYETAIPHATFRVMEDGDVYCRGIVFRLADLEVTP